MPTVTGATAYYDPAANTLTLDNAQLTSSGFGAVWAQEENFTLVLKGENQITGEGGLPSLRGLFPRGYDGPKETEA